jgi:hypothetical protein
MGGRYRARVDMKQVNVALKQFGKPDGVLDGYAVGTRLGATSGFVGKSVDDGFGRIRLAALQRVQSLGCRRQPVA